jgi:transcription elongation factor Elf1
MENEIDSSYVINNLKANKILSKLVKCPSCLFDTTYETWVTGTHGNEKHFIKCLSCDTEFEWNTETEAYEVV